MPLDWWIFLLFYNTSQMPFATICSVGCTFKQTAHHSAATPFAIPFSSRIVKDFWKCSKFLNPFWATKEFPYRQSQQLKVERNLLPNYSIRRRSTTWLTQIYLHFTYTHVKYKTNFRFGSRSDLKMLVANKYQNNVLALASARIEKEKRNGGTEPPCIEVTFSLLTFYRQICWSLVK